MKKKKANYNVVLPPLETEMGKLRNQKDLVAGKNGVQLMQQPKYVSLQ